MRKNALARSRSSEVRRMLPLTRKTLLALAAATGLLQALPASPLQDDAMEGEAAAETPAAPKLTFSDAPIDPELARLAREATRGDWSERRAAVAALIERNGHGVAPLMNEIDADADIETRVQAIATLRRLPQGGTLAMIAGLHSPQAMV